MAALVIDYLGWAATAVFVGSYLCTRADSLKRVQMIGALMWVCYGLLIRATPVVAANVLVFAAAAWALSRPQVTQFPGASQLPVHDAERRRPARDSSP
jgi:hypothetical protein